MSDDADDKPSESLERSDNLATPSVQTKKKKIRRGVRPRVETRRRKRNPTQNKKPSIIVRARTHTLERERKKRWWWCCRDHRRGARSRVFFRVFIYSFLSFDSSLKIEIRLSKKSKRRMELLFSSSSSPPVALSAVFIVNLRGDVLIERQYRSDVTRRDINAFKTEILNPIGQRKSVKRASTLSSSKTPSKGGYTNAVDVQSLPPVRVVGRVKFMFIRVANVYVCAATKLNANASMCFAFLKSAIGTFQVRDTMVHHHFDAKEREKMTTNVFFLARTPFAGTTDDATGGTCIKGGGFRCAMPRSRGSASRGECVLFFSSAR